MRILIYFLIVIFSSISSSCNLRAIEESNMIHPHLNVDMDKTSAAAGEIVTFFIKAEDDKKLIELKVEEKIPGFSQTYNLLDLKLTGKSFNTEFKYTVPTGATGYKEIEFQAIDNEKFLTRVSKEVQVK